MVDMRNYYYLNHDGRVIRLAAKCRPSRQTKNYVWTAQEFDGKGWYSPVISEITWLRLSRLQYIGSVKIPKIIGLAE